FSVNGTRVDIRFMSLYQLIVRAYRVKLYQLSGPNWMHAQRFDITARLPEGRSRDQVPQMLKAMLAERFNLSIHCETREQPICALVVGKSGPKLRASVVKD